MVKIINLEKIKKERCQYSPLTRPAPAPYDQSHFLIFQIPFKKDGGGAGGGGGAKLFLLKRVFLFQFLLKKGGGGGGGGGGVQTMYTYKEFLKIH